MIGAAIFLTLFEYSGTANEPTRSVVLGGVGTRPSVMVYKKVSIRDG